MEKYLASVTHGADYLLFRPKPPNKLIDRILEFLGDKVEIAVDAGCGSGQCTSLLAKYFTKVVAVDSDSIQIQNAEEDLKSFKNITFHVGNADKLPCGDGTVSLVTAIQCAHWFDMKSFYKEVERVLVPNGVLAISGYRLPKAVTQKGNDLSSNILKLFNGEFGEYIPEESKMVYLDNYRSGPFKSVPFSKEPIIREDFDTDPKEATMGDLLGYMRTWSTYQNYLKKNGESAAEEALKNSFPGISSTESISIIFPYFLLLSRKN